MAARIASGMNKHLSMGLTPSDQNELASFVEEYFCNDSDNEEPLTDGKCIHNFHEYCNNVNDFFNKTKTMVNTAPFEPEEFPAGINTL